MDKKWSKCIHTLNGNKHQVSSVSFSADSSLLSSASHDGTARIWEVDTGSCIQILKRPGWRLDTICFLADGRLASLTISQGIMIWRLDTGDFTEIQGSKDVASIASSARCPSFVSGHEDSTVRVWGAAKGANIRIFRCYEGHVKFVALSHDGQLVASVSFKPLGVQIWSVDTGQCVNFLRGKMAGIGSIAFSLDGTLVAAATFTKYSTVSDIMIWSVETGDHGRTIILDADTRKCVRAISIEDAWDDAAISSIVSNKYSLHTDNLSFSTDGKLLMHKSWLMGVHSTPTRSGIFPFPRGTHVFPIFDLAQTASAFHICEKREWVIWKGHRLLWLPLEVRPPAPRVRGRVILSHSSVVIVTPGRRLAFIGFRPDQLPGILQNQRPR